MKKVLVSLALLLSLAAIPVGFAARSDDAGTLPFESRQLSPARDIAALGGLEHEGGRPDPTSRHA